jgi:hypothetical protein
MKTKTMVASLQAKPREAKKAPSEGMAGLQFQIVQFAGIRSLMRCYPALKYVSVRSHRRAPKQSSKAFWPRILLRSSAPGTASRNQSSVL